MVEVIIEHLIWDDWNVNHIKKHKVKVQEVQEAVKSKTKTLKSYQKRMLVLGQTEKKRLLTIVLAKEKKGDITMIKKIPKFKSLKEEAKFWDSHDVTDYLAELTPVALKAKLAGKKEEVLTIRIQSNLKEKMEKLAQDYGLNVSTMVRLWVIDKMKNLKKPQLPIS